MVDQVVSASLANRLQKIIDGSIDSRLQSALDIKVCSVMLRVNDETAKNQLEFAKPSATPIKPNFSIVIIKIATITLIQPRSVVFYVHPTKWELVLQ
jgi:hypothetical protein